MKSSGLQPQKRSDFVCVCVCAQSLSCVQPFATPWTVVCQAPLCMGFSRQEYWNRLPFPPPGKLPDPGVEPECPVTPELAGRFFTICPSGKHCTYSFNPNSEFGTNSWLSGKESVCNAGDPDSISGSGRSPGEGNGNLFQYSCLENFTDRGAWQAIVHGVPKSQTWLSMHVLLSQRPRWLWKILVRKFLHWPCYCSDGLGRY